MNTLETYLDLIPSANRNQPTFIATLSVWLNFYVYMQALLASISTLFYVRTAVGAQLDVVGIWVGVSRDIAVPITGVYFTWDDVDSDGWDFGVWKGPFDPTSGIVSMPDDVYRNIILGKIAANNWDGTTPGAYAVFAIAFPNIPMYIEDHQDMTMLMGFPGPPLDSLTKALIEQNYIPLKPEGVGIAYAFSTTNAPIFGWDIENSSISGWDEGTWAEIN